jgi:tetratricopeptide (TPR) repeat protein
MAEARVERRLAAILAADVAGYSRLMGVDEEGTLAALKAYRRELIDPKISEHRGRIVKSTGDGALVEFASAVDAVRCAMEIQRAMAERNAHVGRDLGVRYVLEGSVRKSGKRVRITAQLIDASTGNHIWSDRYDGELTDVFALQDKITNSVAAAIEPRLLEAEGVRSQNRSPSDIRAWDMAMQANFLFWRLTKADGEAAISILRRTIERYPDYAPAHSMSAFMLLLLGYLGFIAPQVKQAAVLATRAAELDNSDPWAHVALGYVAFTERRTDESVAQFQRALDLNPNFAAAHGYLGWTLAFDGQSDRAIAHSEAAIRMSPHDPQDVIFYGGMAAAHYLAGRYDEAINNALRLLQHRPTFTGALRLRVAALAQAGRLDEARAALERLKELQPDLSIAWIEKNVPYTPAPMAKFLEGWRKVGLQ